MWEAHGLFPTQVMNLTFEELFMMQGVKQKKTSGGDLAAMYEWWSKATPEMIYQKAIGG